MSKKAVKTVITFAVAVVIIIATIIPAVMIADTTSASGSTAEASETAVTTIVAPEHNPIGDEYRTFEFSKLFFDSFSLIDFFSLFVNVSHFIQSDFAAISSSLFWDIIAL